MEPTYLLLSGETDYRQACDKVIALAQREVLIFDHDLVRLRINEKPRIALLEKLLSLDRANRLRLVLHFPESVSTRAPRLMELMARYSHQIEARQTPDNLRHLADSQVLADKLHAVRRFQFDQPRSAIMLEDPIGVQPWRDRFEELWEQSHRCLSPVTTGL